jgi:hypothetical protein
LLTGPANILAKKQECDIKIKSVFFYFPPTEKISINKPNNKKKCETKDIEVGGIDKKSGFYTTLPFQIQGDYKT